MTTLTLGTAIPALLLGILASLGGGALGGVIVGGKSIGNELAATMGAFYGPLAGLPGLVVGVVLLALIG